MFSKAFILSNRVCACAKSPSSIRTLISLGNILQTKQENAVPCCGHYVKCGTRCFTNIQKFSSKSKSTNEYEDQAATLKKDPEVEAWMNQIAQDFEKGIEPFQVSNEDYTAKIHPQMDAQTNSLKGDDIDPVLGVGKPKTTDAEDADIEIEDFGYLEDDENELEESPPSEKHIPISLKRGRNGVFNVEEMVALLEDENGMDIQVIEVPPEARFVDHMVVVSCKSLRHMRAMAASVEWLYKRKKRKSDQDFHLEGRDSPCWFAVDLGNIALHIFLPEARQHYDIERLWTLGPEHDDQRHYIHDETLNLSAADLFWLETSMDQAAAKRTSGGGDSQAVSADADAKLNDASEAGPQSGEAKDASCETSDGTLK